MEDELSWRTLSANFPHYPKSFGALREMMSILITTFQDVEEAEPIMNDSYGQLCRPPDLVNASEQCLYREQLGTNKSNIRLALHNKK